MWINLVDVCLKKFCLYFLFLSSVNFATEIRKMLAKHKRNMFISFRYDHSRNLRDEIKLSVRRGLAALQRNTDTVATAVVAAAANKDATNIDETMISQQPDNISIDEMTSSDICKDNRAHYLAHVGILKDFIYIRKCWKAICCNSHLFKDKVRILAMKSIWTFVF